MNFRKRKQRSPKTTSEHVNQEPLTILTFYVAVVVTHYSRETGGPSCYRSSHSLGSDRCPLFRSVPLISFVKARAIGESGLRRPWATAELHLSRERPSFPKLIPRSAGAMAFRTAENPLARGTEPNALPGMQYDSSTINNRAASEGGR